VVAFENWELRHAHLKAAHDADQVEWRAVTNQLASAEGAAFDERVSGEIDDEFAPQERGPEWDLREARLEGLVGATFEEIERRRCLMKAAYPFELADGGLVHRQSVTGVYEFCLAASLRPTAKYTPKPTIVFEWIARDVLTLYMGNGSQALRTGWPSNRLEKRARGTIPLFKQLYQRCGEFSWKPRKHLPKHPKPKDFKDGGLDIVVWKPFQDGRTVSMFALGQCACGRTDWENKLRDLMPEDLSVWFEGPTFATPLRFFLVPFHIPNHGHLKMAAQKAGIIMDRARIVMVAEQDDSSRDFIVQSALVDYDASASALMDLPAGV